MKKIIIQLVLLLTIGVQMSAQQVSQETAQAKAVSFLSRLKYGNNYSNVDANWEPSKRVSVHIVQTSIRKNTPTQQGLKQNVPYYIFNASDGQGYVIVSGDERAREILGYSETGSLTEETMPCGMKMLLDLYEEEINKFPQSPIEGSLEVNNKLTSVPKKLAAARININPMLSCQWGQNSPYNGQCPARGGSRCIVGCVATAMSQILYYWGHQNGYNIKASTIPAYTTRSQGLRCEELPATTFDWSNMKDKASSDAAAAKLCRYVGQSVEMDYGTGSSEAWGGDMAPAYRTFFGIDSHVRTIFRSDYNYDAWEETIYNEIASGNPVILGGSYYSSGWAGHAFVCDGYRSSNGYYHINWGWNGSYDGYFSLTALNSSGSTGTGSGSYNICLMAVIGIQLPVAGHEYEKEDSRAAIIDLSLIGSRAFTRNSYEQNFEGITVFNTVYNHLQYDTELVAGLGLYDENGKLLEVLAEAQLGRFDRYDGFGLEFTFGNLSLGKDLKEGTYYIRSISRTPSEDTWRLSTNAEHNYITAKITDTELTLEPSVDLVVSNVKNSSSWYSSSCTATITNNGTEESRGLLYAFSSSKLLNVVQTDLAPGETKTVTLASGSVVKVTSDFDGHHVLWTNSSSVPNIALTACAVNADKDGCFEGQKLVLDVSVTNNSSTSPYDSQVSAKLCKEGSTTAVATKTFYPDVAELGIQTERLEFDGLTYNQPYTITLSSGSYTVEIGNMTTPQPRTFFVYTVTPVERTILPGDANLDGVVTIADVTAVVNRILSKEVETFSEENADVNGDGTITIADVTSLVNIILEK